jgi:hypothetical protein
MGKPLWFIHREFCTDYYTVQEFKKTVSSAVMSINKGNMAGIMNRL